MKPLLWLLYKQRLKNDEGFKRSGAAVAVIKDGEMIISEGFGYRNLETKAPVTPRTLFAIGSSTKAFGTLSLSLLAQQKV